MKDIYLKDERNAKFAARHLSRNLYYEDDFSDSSLRVFLDNLFFPVVSVFFTITVVDNFKSSYCIQVNFDCNVNPCNSTFFLSDILVKYATL